MPPACRTRGKSTNKLMKPSENGTKKRPLENSSVNGPTRKRSALEDLSNVNTKNPSKPSGPQKKQTLVRTTRNKENASLIRAPVHATSIKSKSSQSLVAIDCSDDNSNSSNSSYISASESFESSSHPSALQHDSPKSTPEKMDITAAQDLDDLEHSYISPPDGVDDFDKENWLDPYSASSYVTDIFKYFKEREIKFSIPRYMESQIHITKNMRAILVDWLVEVQESFELNHESLYLAVKLVDIFLSKCKPIEKEILQLVGATSIFIACKFDERIPPVIDDFLYVCDDAYSKEQMIIMEMTILKTIDFDLGIPLSYSFLRRYARCAKLPMDSLTLARYILELSLLEYEFIDVPDSLVAAGALYLALKMKGGDWTPTLKHYSTYEPMDFIKISQQQNLLVRGTRGRGLRTIRSKYSHGIFFEVAKILPVEV